MHYAGVHIVTWVPDFNAWFLRYGMQPKWKIIEYCDQYLNIKK